MVSQLYLSVQSCPLLKGVYLGTSIQQYTLQVISQEILYKYFIYCILYSAVYTVQYSILYCVRYVKFSLSLHNYLAFAFFPSLLFFFPSYIFLSRFPFLSFSVISSCLPPISYLSSFTFYIFTYFSCFPLSCPLAFPLSFI